VTLPSALPWERIGRQLRQPTGLAGRLLGQAMEIANQQPNRAAIAALDIGPGDDVLELGFGPGAAIKVLAELAPAGKIYGVDQSQVMLDLACRRNRAAIRAGQVVLKLGSFDSLPLPDCSVSRILAVNVAYFWSHPTPILKELKRVLRPGGSIAIYVTEASTMRRWKFATPQTHRTFDRQALTELLRNGGFGDDRITIVETRPALGVRGLVATVSKAP